MSLLSKVADMFGKDEAPKAGSAPGGGAGAEASEPVPALPTPTTGYELADRSDGAYDILDGGILVGRLAKETERRPKGNHSTPWVATVREIDARFGTMEDAQAWLIPK
jgi:hypothetical protein